MHTEALDIVLYVDEAESRKAEHRHQRDIGLHEGKTVRRLQVSGNCKRRRGRHHIVTHSIASHRKSQLLAILLCIGSADIALGNQQAEQRFLDVLRDLYKDGILSIEDLSF